MSFRMLDYFRSYHRQVQFSRDHWFLAALLGAALFSLPGVLLILLATRIDLVARIWIASVLLIVFCATSIISAFFERRRLRGLPPTADVAGAPADGSDEDDEQARWNAFAAMDEESIPHHSVPVRVERVHVDPSFRRSTSEESGGQGGLEIRPSWAAYRASRPSVWAAYGWPLGLAVLGTLNRSWLFSGVAAACVAVALLARDLRARRYVRHARVVVSEDEIEYFDAKRSRRWPRAAFGRALTVSSLASAGRDSGRVIVLDREGERMFVLAFGVWADDDRARLVAELGTHERWPAKTRPHDLILQHPHALRRFEPRSPRAARLDLAAVAIVAGWLAALL